MSTVAVNEITDEVGTGSPAFTNGLAQSDIAGALNATGTTPIYACRAWVNFDGTTATPTIRASGNVSSVTKTATGQFTINFSTSMTSADYNAVTAVGDRADTGHHVSTINTSGPHLASSLGIATGFVTSGVDGISDRNEINVAIFR